MPPIPMFAMALVVVLRHRNRAVQANSLKDSQRRDSLEKRFDGESIAQIIADACGLRFRKCVRTK